MEVSSKYSVGDVVYVLSSKAVRRNKLCPDCKNEAMPIGERCLFCQGYGDVFDRVDVVWEVFGPSEVYLVNVLVKESGVSFTYCIPDTWDKPHEEEFVFESEREANACRRVHL